MVKLSANLRFNFRSKSAKTTARVCGEARSREPKSPGTLALFWFRDGRIVPIATHGCPCTGTGAAPARTAAVPTFGSADRHGARPEWQAGTWRNHHRRQQENESEIPGNQHRRG